MNKLLVSDIIKLSNETAILNSKSNELKIIIEDKVTIYLIDESINKLIIDIENNSELKLYKLNKVINNNLDVEIVQNNDSKVYYNESFINDKDSLLTINNYIKGNNNESNINIRNISNNNESKIVINVNINKLTNNNIALEDLKGINNGGLIHIEPNIICDSNEVVANHFTTIGSIDKNLLNYLMGKGISEDKAKELLLNSFIYSNMDNYIKEFWR